MDFIPDPYYVKKTEDSFFKLWLQFSCVTSTNEVAEFHVKNGYSSNFMVSSEEQSEGKGRNDRKWDSPEGGCYITFCTFVPDSFDHFCVPLVAGAAVYELCSAYGRKENWAVKWPNDVMYNVKGTYRKVAGILCESFDQDDQKAVITGIGINIESEFIKRKDLLQPAISLYDIEKNIQRTSHEFIEQLAGLFVEKLEIVQENNFSSLIASAGDIFLIGKKVEVVEYRETYEAVIEGIAEDGALLVKRSSEDTDIPPSIVKVYSADIKLL